MLIVLTLSISFNHHTLSSSSDLGIPGAAPGFCSERVLEKTPVGFNIQMIYIILTKFF